MLNLRRRIVVVEPGLTRNDVRPLWLFPNGVKVPNFNEFAEFFTYDWHIDRQKSNAVSFPTVIVLAAMNQALEPLLDL